MTHNISFINISSELKKRGIENNSFMLRTVNPELDKLSSCEIYEYFVNCDEKYFSLILDECRDNIWFFFREIARVGPYSSPFQLTIESLMFIWCYLHGISCIITSNLRQHGLTTIMELIYIYHRLFADEGKFGCYQKFDFTMNKYLLSDNILNANSELLAIHQNKIIKDIILNTDTEYIRVTSNQYTFFNAQQTSNEYLDKYYDKFKDTTSSFGKIKYFTFGFDIYKFNECVPFMIALKNRDFFVYANVLTGGKDKIEENLLSYIKYSIPEINISILDDKKAQLLYKIYF